MGLDALLVKQLLRNNASIFLLSDAMDNLLNQCVCVCVCGGGGGGVCVCVCVRLTLKVMQAYSLLDYYSFLLLMLGALLINIVNAWGHS